MNNATSSSPNSSTAQAAPKMAPFGSVFAPTMGITWYRNGAWTPAEVVPANQLVLHPGTHALHYASACFEGLKAYRLADGSVATFRLADHIKRMQQSARLMSLPEPGSEQLRELINSTLRDNQASVPAPPAAMYIRPTLLGTELSIGKAAKPSSEAVLYILLSPVGDYFEGGMSPLSLLIDDEHMRTAPTMGMVKCGANYAMALPHIMHARSAHGADQVLFCPGGIAQETGAANFLLLDKERVVTKDLDSTFLHGVTRSAVLELAKSRGMQVEERPITVQEILEWAARGGEAALSGTAAVLAGVGNFIYRGEHHAISGGQVGPVTLELRQALVNIQLGNAPDPFGWRAPIA